MSDKAEELASQLLNKTLSGKLRWYFVQTDGSESYQTDLEGGLSFRINRTTRGDNKVLTLSLAEPSRIILTAEASNFPISDDFRRIMEQGRAILYRNDEGKQAEPVD